MNQLRYISIYNSPFKESYSHPIHTCFPIIASNDYSVSFTAEVEFEFTTWAWVQATAGTAMGGGFIVLSPGLWN